MVYNTHNYLLVGVCPASCIVTKGDNKKKLRKSMLRPETKIVWSQVFI
jgi:hypothetical protein